MILPGFTKAWFLTEDIKRTLNTRDRLKKLYVGDVFNSEDINYDWYLKPEVPTVKKPEIEKKNYVAIEG